MYRLLSLSSEPNEHFNFSYEIIKVINYDDENSDINKEKYL